MPIYFCKFIISKLRKRTWPQVRDALRWCIIAAMLILLAYAYWNLYTGVNSGVLPAPNEVKLTTPEILGYLNRISISLHAVMFLGACWFALSLEKWGLFKHIYV